MRVIRHRASERRSRSCSSSPPDTATNLSASADVLPLYRRVMDWDVEPTRFYEYVTIGSLGPLPRALRFTSDDGFARADPLTSWSSLGARRLLQRRRARRRGGFFEFGFPRLAPGEAKTFYLYYGAAPDEASALAALAAVGAQVYSFGQPSGPGGPDQGIPQQLHVRFPRPSRATWRPGCQQAGLGEP